MDRYFISTTRKSRLIARALVFAFTLFISTISHGENLNSKAKILVNDSRVNNGKAFNLLKNAKGALWVDMTPFTQPDYIEIWLPYDQVPIISSFKIQGLRDAISKADAQAFVGGKWNSFGNLPVSDITPTGSSVEVHKFSFTEPIKTRGIRIRIDDSANTDHEQLKIKVLEVTGELSEDAKSLFSDGDLTVSCNSKFNVFDLPQSGKINISVANSLGTIKDFNTTVEWTFSGGQKCSQAPLSWSFSLDKGKSKDLIAELNTKEQGPYHATVKIWDKKYETLLSCKRILIGMRDVNLLETGNVKSLAPAGQMIVNIDKRIAEHGTLWGADVTQSCYGSPGVRPGSDYFKTVKKAGAEVVMSYMTYKTFEPLPGVYNFAAIDELISLAKESDIGLNLGLWWWDFKGPTQYWLADERILKRDGTTGKGWSGIYSLHSRKFSKHALRAIELVVKRYKNSPEVWLWHLHPYGAVDHDGHGLFDFHPDAMTNWKLWLENKYSTIDNLNAIYKTDYTTFSDVTVPEPTYDSMTRDGKLTERVRHVDNRVEWVDWLSFYHGKLLSFREEAMKIVRKHDSNRGIGGVNATGGVGKADETLSKLKEYNAFFGDQGLNLINSHFRRLTAKRRYGLKLRLEDIIPVTVNRNGITEENIASRCDWDVFQLTTLGAEHFNYVFTASDNSVFFDRVLANPLAKNAVKESSKLSLDTRPIAYMHSFETDIFEGKYDYSGISLYRWWLMSGFSEALVLPGNSFEMYTDKCDMSGLKEMKLIIDDGSSILDPKAVDALVEYVQNGGKLILMGQSGRYQSGNDTEFEFLKKLGYGDTSHLVNTNTDSAQLIFAKKNPVFRKIVSMPVTNWRELKAPKGGRSIGKIGNKDAAVLWPFGKGEVCYLGGLPGSICESKVQELYDIYKTDKRDRRVFVPWRNAERELGSIIQTLTKDISEWAGVKPLFELDQDFYAISRSNTDEKLIYIYNRTEKRVPVLRISLPEGAYKVVADTLDKSIELATFDNVAQLSAPGIALPPLGKNRFMAVRITKVK